MLRALAFLYGVIAYVLFLGVFLYAVCFIGGFLVPITLDTPTALDTTQAVIIDLALLGLFGIQHSGMARQGFKRFWTRFVPQPVERSTYVLFTNAVLALLMWKWQGLDQVIWSVQNPVGRDVLWALFAAGWLLVLLSTFAVSHTDLFGLRQVYNFLRNRYATPFTLKTGSLYALVRHPLLLGFVIAFWATPHMTAGHLLFTLTATAYMLVAIQLEERDMVEAFGERYVEYRKQVPMLLPTGRRNPR